MKQVMRHARALLRLMLRRPIVAVTVVPVLEDGRIVMVRRVDDGLWSLPGGFIDWGEDLAAAARRELREEAGLELRQVRRLVGVYTSPERDPRFHAIAILVEAEVSGEPRSLDPLEIAEATAFALDSLPPGPYAHQHDRLLRDFRGGKLAWD